MSQSLCDMGVELQAPIFASIIQIQQPHPAQKQEQGIMGHKAIKRLEGSWVFGLRG